MRKPVDNGLILVTAVMIATVLITLLTVNGTRTTTNVLVSHRSANLHQAFYLAESAVDVGLSRLRYGEHGDVPLTSLAGGTYWAEILEASEDPDLAAGQFRIRGHGESPPSSGNRRHVEVVAELIPVRPFQFALFGDQSADLLGSSFTDSYDSTKGSYHAGNPDAGWGHLGTNAIAPQAVYLSGTTEVRGSVAVRGADSSVVFQGDGAHITGVPPIIDLEEPIPMVAVEIPPALTCVDRSYTRGETVTLYGDVCYDNLSLSANASLLPDPGNPGLVVTLYLKGLLYAGGGASLGDPGSPGRLRILVSPQGGTQTLLGNSVIYAALYAPMSTVHLEGSAKIFGSLLGRHVEFESGAAVVYDRALQNVTLPLDPAAAVTVWREDEAGE